MIPTRLALALAAVFPFQAALAAELSVGEPGDADCSHASLADALSAAAADPSGPHRIRLAFASRLDTSAGVIDQLVLSDPLADIVIEGRYPSCAASEPLSDGSRSEVGFTEGSIGRILRASNAGAMRSLTLRRVNLVRGNSTSFPLPDAYGGAILARGNLELVLDQASVTASRSTRGGGVAVMDGATLTLENGSNIGANQAESVAGRGGGIYCAGRPSRVQVRRGSVIGNSSRGDGGGIYLDDCSGLFQLPNPIGGFNSFLLQNNSAGEFGDGARGFGGAIHSFASEIQIAESTLTTHAAVFIGNSAERGGAIYTRSDASGSAVLVTLMDSVLASNGARDRGGALFHLDGADVLIGSTRDAPCSFTGFIAGQSRTLPGCSLIAGNRSDHGGGGAAGGGVAYLATAGAPASPPRLHIQRSRISFNHDNGPAALVHAESGQVWLANSIVLDNTSAAGSASMPALLRLAAPGPHLLRHSTVLDNAVLRVAHVQGSELDATGSLVWAPDGIDMQELWEAGAGGSLVHRGCLLTSTFDDTVPLEDLGGGFFSDGQRSNDPLLDADFRPLPGSRALDGCASSRADSGLDFYGLPRGFDVPGTVNFVWSAQFPDAYVNDLGAVELSSEALFADGFESP